jgi:hypothetical protein
VATAASVTAASKSRLDLNFDPLAGWSGHHIWALSCVNAAWWRAWSWVDVSGIAGAVILFIRSGQPTEIISKAIMELADRPNNERTVATSEDGERKRLHPARQLGSEQEDQTGVPALRAPGRPSEIIRRRLTGADARRIRVCRLSQAWSTLRLQSRASPPFDTDCWLSGGTVDLEQNSYSALTLICGWVRQPRAG